MSVLSITRKTGERVRLAINGVNVWIIVSSADRRTARLTIDAPRDVQVQREELLPIPAQYEAVLNGR